MIKARKHFTPYKFSNSKMDGTHDVTTLTWALQKVTSKPKERTHLSTVRELITMMLDAVQEFHRMGSDLDECQQVRGASVAVIGFATLTAKCLLTAPTMCKNHVRFKDI